MSGEGLQRNRLDSISRTLIGPFVLLLLSGTTIRAEELHWPFQAREVQYDVRQPGPGSNRLQPIGFGRPNDEGLWNLRSWFRHGDPDQQGRHIGKGEPLHGTSWLNRRWHAGWFFGGIFPQHLIDGQVDQKEEVFGGYRIGWDFDHYWGAEARFGFANAATQILTDPVPRSSRDLFWDVQLLYYPWGDAHWRPYTSLGLGTANFRFTDHLMQPQNEVLLHIPMGIGVKYYFKKWLAVRLDAMDNFAISGSGLDTMHNLSITGGVEVHFGSRQVHYSL